MSGDWFSRATPGDGTNLFDARVHNQADQVFLDGQMMPLARWPNQATNDPSFPAKSACERFVSKTRDAATQWTTGVMEDDAFDLSPESAVGAQIFFQPNWNAWSWLFTGRITAVDGHRFTFQSRSDAGKDFSQKVYDARSRYYLFDKLTLLDAPGEWYHDKAAGVLHLMPPDRQSPEGRVSAKRREYAFDLTGLSHIVVRGFTLHACTLTTDRDSGGDNVPYGDDGAPRYPWRNAAHGLPRDPYHRDDYKDAPSTNVVVDSCEISYPTHFTDVSGHFECQWGQSSGVVLSGRGHVISNCRIRYSAGNGIVLLGREHRALGNVIEDVDYAATDCGAIHTGVTERASTDHEIAWNTVRRCGRSGIMIRQMTRRDTQDGSLWKGRVHHNDVSAFGLQDADLGGICSTGYDGRYVRIDHNWVHDACEIPDNLPGASGFTASGIYLDYSARFLVDHNVVWNVEWGIHLQNQTGGDIPAGHVVLHNTVAVRSLGGKPQGYGPFGVVRNSKAPFRDTLIANNILLRLDQSPGFKPVDFDSDPALNRAVENNPNGHDAATLGLVGGDTFPAALLPRPDASNLVDAAILPTPTPVNGITPPDWRAALHGKRPDVGAKESGLDPWQPGHQAWKR
jgi:hypothetical protein